ncbi:hypothetical protein [Methanoplanus endosymbiosus]|uniref:Uncharacterized protein n=1 Tax=Methanoplanus endosymbiosus TaxID=33865 RepID=A0A9E7TI92_9EURY|nr:hypothetical protein [Methanoplanus endosymbiosus]UUX92068.1 hypothetical protein L6E24_11995 [Methanoplanus endosymbiosus]
MNVKRTDVSPLVSAPTKVKEQGTDCIIDAESVYNNLPASAINLSLLTRTIANRPANEDTSVISVTSRTTQKQLQTFIKKLSDAVEQKQAECDEQERKISELSALIEMQEKEIEIRLTNLEDNVKELKEDSELFERYARTAIENTKYQVRKLDVQNILNENELKKNGEQADSIRGIVL